MTREKAHELVERYLYKVGDDLPAAQRDDVKNELRSLLEEQLEEHAAAAGRPTDEEMAVEVLRAFGNPQEVAARYQPPGRYLIGPRLFPTYVTVAKIVLTVLAAIYAGSVGLALLVAPSRMPEMFRPESVLGFFGSYFNLAFLNLAILTLIFALIERFGDTSKKREEWDPRKLPAVPADSNPDKISEPGLVFKIYAIVALFTWVNFFPETLGFWFFAGDQVRTIHFTELGLRLPVLLLNIWWGCALALNVWLLRLGRWTRESRWAEFGLGVSGAAILYLVIVSSALTGPESGALTLAWEEGPFNLMEIARANLPRLGRLLHYLLSFILLATVVEALVRLYRILRRYPVW